MSSTEAALRSEFEQVRELLSEWEMLGAKITGCTNHSGRIAIEDANHQLDTHISVMSSLTDTQRDRAEAAEARVLELEAALTERTNAAWEACRGNERQAAEITRLERQLHVAVEDCAFAVSGRDTLQSRLTESERQLAEAARMADQAVQIGDALQVQLDKTLAELAAERADSKVTRDSLERKLREAVDGRDKLSKERHELFVRATDAEAALRASGVEST